MESRRFVIAAIAFALGAASPTLAGAQDWVKVAPAGKKVLLDNAQVRVVEVTLAPGQKEPVHTHPANLAYLLDDGKIRVSYVGGESPELEGEAGDAFWSDPEGPHSMENLSGHRIRFVLVELKEHPYAPPAKGKN